MSADEVRIAALEHVTPVVVAHLNALVGQLSSSATVLDAAAVRALVESPATTVLAGYGSEDEILGMLTLAVFAIPTGTRAWIEDVVVDGAARGRGVGRALTLHAIERAAQAGARTVELTSRPSREAANALYRSLGFKTRETNLYRFTIAASAG